VGVDANRNSAGKAHYSAVHLLRHSTYISVEHTYFPPVPVVVRSKAKVCGRWPAEIVGSNPIGGMDVCCECRVLLGRGLSDELITRPEDSYRLRCVVVCDLESS
jgi:hypothetical protein